MRKNPAVQMIWQFTEAQYQAVRKTFIKDKRSHTLKLLTIIRSYQKKELTKEELFRKLYGEPLSPQKDYLLRNELRLLRQKLDKYLLQTAVGQLLDEDEMFRQKMMLFAYKHHKLYDLFYETFDKAEDFALSTFQFDQALYLQNWQLDLAYQHQFSAVKDYEQKVEFFHEKGKKFQQTFEGYAAMHFRLRQFYASMEAYYKMLLHQPVKPVNLDEDEVQLKLADHALSRYYFFRSKAFYVSGEQRLNYFLQAYDALKSHEPRDRYIIDLLITVLLGIGRVLQQLGDFKRADEYMSMAIKEYGDELPTLASKEKFYANYLTNLLNIGKYEKALELSKHLQKETNDLGYTRYWYSIYELIAYIGLGKVKEIKNNLPVNHSEIPQQHRIYYRVINSIYYYLIDEHEWAYKEVYNLMHTKLADDYGKEQRQVIELVENFFQLNDKYARKDNIPSRDITRLQRELAAIDTSKINDVNILPVLLWLRKEITLAD